jgi:hypothetical protein
MLSLQWLSIDSHRTQKILFQTASSRKIRLDYLVTVIQVIALNPKMMPVI